MKRHLALLAFLLACGGGSTTPSVVADKGLPVDVVLDQQEVVAVPEVVEEAQEELPPEPRPTDVAGEEILAPAPTVTSIEPNAGPASGGSLVAIKGIGFRQGLRVFFDDKEASNVTVGGDALLTCITPPHPAGTADVVVRNPDGQEGKLAQGFTFQAVQVLGLQSVSPSEGPATGGNLVSLQGTGFVPETKVYFGDKTALDINVGGSTLLTCKVPAGEPGIVDVAVRNPDGAEAVLQGAYKYLPLEELGVSAVSPSEGPETGGQVVVVTGTGFEDGTVAFFGDTAAVSNSVVGPHTMVVTTPAHGPGPVDVSVRTPAGKTAKLANAYVFLPVGTAKLALFSVLPASGPVAGGTQVVLKGQGFMPGAKVYFGTNQAYNVAVESQEVITCITPKGAAGFVPVTVENLDSEKATLQDAFEYLVSEHLTLSSITPAKGPVEGGNIAMLTGTGFEPGLVVRFGETPSPTVSVAGAHLAVVQVPAHDAGTVDVTAESPSGETAVLKAAYTYEAKEVGPGLAPTIASVWPKKGPTSGGTLLVITGSSFAEGAVAILGGAQCKTTFVDSSHLLAETPPGTPGTKSLTVKNPDGQSATLSGAFTYQDPTLPQPTIESVEPNSGPTTGGALVVIGGSGFQTGAKVIFGQKLAQEATVESQSKVVAITPPGEEGTVSVFLVNPDGQVAVAQDAYAYFVPGTTGGQPPVLTQVDPTAGPIDGGQEVRVFGLGFVQESRVFFGTAEANVTGLQGGSVLKVVTAPKSPGLVDVWVVNPDGLFARLQGAYTYFEPPPVIASVEPSSGPEAGGTAVEVRGKNFREGASVRFGGVEAAATFDSTTLIKAVTPPHMAGLVDVTVRNPSGLSDTLIRGFEYVAPKPLPAPKVTAVQPNHGPAAGGTTVVVFGENFVSGAVVLFDTTPVETKFFGDSVLTAVTPKGDAGKSVDVKVKNPDGQIGALAKGFSYDLAGGESLTVTGVSPASGPTSGGTFVTVFGSGFTSGTVVSFDQKDAQTTFLSSTTLSAVTPPGKAGLIDVRVRRPDGATAIAFNAFSYVEPGAVAPTVAGVEPSVGPTSGGTFVLIGGAGFKPEAKVFFGAKMADSVQVLSEGSLTAVTPPGQPGAVAVSVVNSDGASGTLAGAFTYYDAQGSSPPAVFAVDPFKGQALGGDDITVFGQGFKQGLRLYICQIPAAVKAEVLADRFGAVTPGGPVGLCDVTVVNPDGLSGTLTGGFKYIPATPAPKEVIPPTGPKEGGTAVVIQGSGFMDGATVKFGNNLATGVERWSATVIKAVTPPGPVGAVDVVVTNPGGVSGTLPSGFKYTEGGTAANPPTVTAVVPPKGPLGGGTPVEVVGSNFEVGAMVVFGQTVVQGAIVVSPDKITLVTPKAEAAGPVNVTVLNPDGMGYTLKGGFTYEKPTNPPPVLIGVSPGAGPEQGGTLVTITGAYLQSGATLTLGDNPLKSPAFVSETLITAVTPPGKAGLADLQYVGPDGQTAKLAGAFTYLPAPKLDKVSPAFGPLAGGTEVTLYGSNFQIGVKAFFGSKEATVLHLDSSFVMVVSTPAATTAGQVDVKVQNTDGQFAVLSNGYEYLAAPKVTSVLPNAGPEGGGTLCDVVGSGFYQDSKVFFEETPAASVTYVSPSKLFVATPAHDPGKVAVSVENRDKEKATLADAFTFKASQGLDPAPVVDSISPTKGPETGGTPVAIEGENFVNGAVVKFGALEGVSTVVVGPKLILTTTPAQPPSKVKVAVMNPDGQVAFAPSMFEYTAAANQLPPPKVVLVNPASGPVSGGTVVTVSGNEFQDGALVLFGNTPAIQVDFVSKSEVRAVSPAHAKGAVDVTVVNPDGQSHTLPGSFTFLAPPKVVSVNPKAGPAAGGTVVTILGDDFVKGASEASQSRVVFCKSFSANEDCVAAAFEDTKVNDVQSITVKTPPHAAGLVDVAVVNPDGQSGYLAKGYTFNPLPVITAVSPASGTSLGGTQVTITGSGFQEGAKVLFGTTPANNVVVVGPTGIACLTPPGTGTVSVTVRNPDGGQAVVADAFTYIPPPTISKVVPSTGPESGGISVTIEGTGFSKNPISRVYFGPKVVPEADTSVLSATAIVVIAPSGQGSVTVKVQNPDGQVASLDQGFTYVPPTPAPVISYLVPTKGSTLGGYAVQVVGNNFMEGARVFFGKTGDWTEALGVSVKNAGTLISLTAPSRPEGLVDVRVVNTDGQEAIRKDAFEFVPPQSQVPLKVFGVEPSRAVVSGGSVVTVSGQGFKPTVQIAFGKSPDWAVSSSVEYVSSTLLRVVVPPAPGGNAGKVDVRAANPPTAGGQEVFVLTDGFTYTRGAVFTQAPGHRMPPEPHGKVAAFILDVNGDGVNDVLVSREDPNGWSASWPYLLVNTPLPDGRKGWFQRRSFPGVGKILWAVSGDFDEDSDMDVFLKASNNRFYYCSNDGAGNFSCADLGYYDCGESRFVAADLNCDSHLDVFVPRNSTSTSCPNFIFVGNGKGGFEVRSTDVLPAHYENSTAAAVADVDLDGDLDILVANDNAMQKRLYYNNCNNVAAPPACGFDIPGCTMANYSGHRYAFCPDGRAWGDAEARCKLYGFHLATINSAEEQTFIRAQMGSTSWVGYNDIASEGKWTWVGGSSTYTLWCGGEPNGGTNENCAFVSTNSNGCWVDAACTNGYRYVCEADVGCPVQWKFTDAQYGAGKNFPISGGNTKDVALVDLDRNGFVDAIVANWGQQTAVYMNYGGNFQLDDGFHWPQNEAVPRISKLYPVDIDLDGDMDVIAFVDGGIRVYTNDLSQGGAGLLTDASSTALPSLSNRGDLAWVAVGDLDQDLLPDIFWVNNYHTDRLLMNNGFDEGKAWTQANRVGFGRFRFNTYEEVPEVTRDGVAAVMGDIDKDGRPDLIAGGANARLFVYHNVGSRFVDESKSRFPDTAFNMALNAMALVDLNRDGDLDVVLNHYGYSQYQFVNNGQGVFTDVTSWNIVPSNWYWSVVSTADFDGDGDQDVFVAGDRGYWDYGWRFLVNGGDVFNNDGGYLLDKTSFYAQQASPPRYVRAAVLTDINYDGRPDLYLGTAEQNLIFINDPTKGFIAATTQYLPAINDDTRDVVMRDFDGDGDEDIFVVNWGQDRFHVRESLAKFSDVTTSALPALSLQSQGAAAGDVDKDGLPEVFVANWEQKNTFYYNLGGDRFADFTANLPDDWDGSRHIFLFDWDGDGDLDLYVVNNGQDRIYVNQQ